MNYTAVDSSQIAEVGFGDGYYGPETLGIRFPPNKKQTMAGEPGSEYHYQNFTPKLHAEFLAAESIGSYFGKNIKSRPDLYPFVKVETESSDPTPPAPKKTNGSGETSPSKTADGAGAEPEGTVEPPSPGTALAVIDTLRPEFIFVPGNLDPILIQLRQQVLAMAVGLTPATPASQKRIRDVKNLVAKRRTFIEKVRVGYVADLVAKKGLTDTVSRTVQAKLSDIESEILEVTGYAAWEQGEKEFESRMTGLQNRIAGMGKEMHLYTSCASLDAAIKELESFDTAETREHKKTIELAIDNSLRVLKPELARRQEAERNAAELAELKRKQAERDEQDRLAEQKRQDDLRIKAEAEKLAAEIVASKQPPPYIPAPHEEQGAPIGEVQRVSYPPAPGLVAPVPQTPLTTETHEQIVHAAIVEALRGCELTRQEAVAVLQAIVDGRIPHVAVSY